MAASAPSLHASSARRALSGFFVSGLLFSFPGAILPAWGYHVHSDSFAIGNYFLFLSIGILLSIRTSQFALRKRRPSELMAISCGLAFAALLFLAFTGPPIHYGWRLFGFLLIGLAAGLLNTSIFHSISATYRHDPAATMNIGGTLFGLGCLLTALLVAGTFYIYTVGSILFLIAIIPALFAGIYARSPFAAQPGPQPPAIRQAIRDFKSLGAILFTLLLFFQFGNEWSIAGWLALFLIRRLGISPASSLFLLALYWFALLVGRMAVQALMRRVNHAKILLLSTIAALFGCVILIATNNVFGAVVGTLFVGGGFAPIYPLVVEMIGSRFTYYHPGFFNGIFSLALTGGLLAPWTLGYFVELWGIETVMALPLVGTCMVFLLLILIWIETKLTQPVPAKLKGA